MLHFATAGTILGLKTMNMNMIVLHKIKDAQMLLDKRSSIYSDRPVLPVVKLYVTNRKSCEMDDELTYA